jgi:hypothetical protein
VLRRAQSLQLKFPNPLTPSLTPFKHDAQR